MEDRILDQLRAIQISLTSIDKELRNIITILDSLISHSLRSKRVLIGEFYGEA